MKKTDQKLLFEKFRIIETIKQDSNRAVYIAEHVFLNKTIFLKTINKENLSDPVLLDRFKREARILAKLDHPNIIKVWDFGTYQNYFYISFEHFKSRNLRETLHRPKLSDDAKRKLILQLNSGLNYAHQYHIIHRDLKPENILLDKQLKLKIADFGLATIEDQVGSTEDTTIVGTPAYMSPEQIRGEELTGQSDLFSMGIIIYEIYCGKNPFLGADTGATLNNILNLNFNSFKTDSQKLPTDMKDLVKKLLLKSVIARPEKTDLPEIEESSTTIKKAEIPNYTKISKRKIWSYISAAVVIILLVFIGYYLGYIPIQLPDKTNHAEDSAKLNSENLSDSIITVTSQGENLSEPNIKNTETVDIPSIKKTPEKDTISQQLSLNQSEESRLQSGFIMVECQPWADIFIDDVKRESTPLKNPLQVSAGLHIVKLTHPEYPNYEQKINIKPDESLYISVNFDTTIGYLSCRVHPWGEIYIDGTIIGQTPLNNPVRLEAGKHVLMIKNPGYPEYKKAFTVRKNDTLSFNINLNKRSLINTTDSI